MKTEKEFSEFFIHICQPLAPLNVAQQQALDLVALNYWADLTSHLSYYFSHSDRIAITEKAAKYLSAELTTKSLDASWKNVIRNFNQNNYWDFKTQAIKPRVAQTEDQKIFWKLFRYIWAFFQSMFILKIAVYYFGLESASNPDQTNVFWVWVFFSFSAFSLAFFAYRNRHDKS